MVADEGMPNEEGGKASGESGKAAILHSHCQREEDDSHIGNIYISERKTHVAHLQTNAPPSHAKEKRNEHYSRVQMCSIISLARDRVASTTANYLIAVS